jgi:hypothetical protein
LPDARSESGDRLLLSAIADIVHVDMTGKEAVEFWDHPATSG